MRAGMQPALLSALFGAKIQPIICSGKILPSGFLEHKLSTGTELE